MKCEINKVIFLTISQHFMNNAYSLNEDVPLNAFSSSKENAIEWYLESDYFGNLHIQVISYISIMSLWLHNHFNQ